VNATQYTYWQLWTRLREAELGAAIRAEILDPWLGQNAEERRWLGELGRRSGGPVPEVWLDDRCRLYALSRVNDLLLLGFQPLAPAAAASAAGERRVGNEPWNGPIPEISPVDYLEFMDALGFEVVERQEFHPFFHEIAALTATPDPRADPKIERVRWPCLMLGPMLFSRAGCDVIGGDDVLRSGIADRSTLYWAWALSLPKDQHERGRRVRRHFMHPGGRPGGHEVSGRADSYSRSW
jgi:hypothetical protein